ncbi:MAG TPA: calcium-binding protein, partial [Allosphingosinicella sp.]
MTYVQDMPTPREQLLFLIDPLQTNLNNSSGFQRAHIVGRDFATRPIVTWFNALFQQGRVRSDGKPINGADDSANGVLLPQDRRGGAILGAAVHNRPHVEAFNQLFQTTPEGQTGDDPTTSDQFMHVMRRDYLEAISDTSDPVALAAELKALRVRLRNYLDYTKLLFLHPEILKRMGFAEESSIMLNGWDARLQDDAAVAARLASLRASGLLDYDRIVGDGDDDADSGSSLYKAIVRIRGGKDESVDDRIIEEFPDAARIIYPGGNVEWNEDVRSDILGRDAVINGYASLNSVRETVLNYSGFNAAISSDAFDAVVGRIRGGLDKLKEEQQQASTSYYLFLDLLKSAATPAFSGLFSENHKALKSVSLDGLPPIESKFTSAYGAIDGFYQNFTVAQSGSALLPFPGASILSSEEIMRFAAQTAALLVGALKVADAAARYGTSTVELEAWLHAPQRQNDFAAADLGLTAVVGTAFAPMRLLAGQAEPAPVAGRHLEIRGSNFGIDQLDAMLRRLEGTYASPHVMDDAARQALAEVIDFRKELPTLVKYSEVFKKFIRDDLDDALERFTDKELEKVTFVSGNGVSLVHENNEVLWGSGLAVVAGNSQDNLLIHGGAGEARGGAGDDVLIGVKGEYLRDGEVVDPYASIGSYARDFVERLNPFTRVDQLILDGGTGDDTVIARGGTRTVTVGGEGRDFIYNTSRGGELYGDTRSGRDAFGDDIDDSPENADLFWFQPNTTIKDPQRNDVLQFYGLTLTGGNANIPILATGIAQGVGGGGVGAYASRFIFGKRTRRAVAPAGSSTSKRSRRRSFIAKDLYFDHLMPFMVYLWDDDSDQLVVVNYFDSLWGIGLQFAGMTGLFDGTTNSDDPNTPEDDTKNLMGAQWVENYDGLATYDGFSQAWLTSKSLGRDDRRGVGELGLLFKEINPITAILSLLPPTLITQALMQGGPLVDEAMTLAAAAMRFAKGTKWAKEGDPLIFDLDGDGIETLSIYDVNTYFDIDGDYFAEATGWIDGDDGFLALDFNRNGLIDDISELFGDQDQSGFAELSLYDTSKDGKISAADAVWGDLRMWQDVNSNGKTDAGELRTMADVGILSIDLAKLAMNAVTPQGALLRARGGFERADGRTGQFYEAIFESDEVDTRYRGETGLADWQAGLKLNVKGYGNMTDLKVAMANDLDMAELVAARSAAMTTPKLKTLLAQAGDVLGAWGQALELTRELVAVLVGPGADGKPALLDRAIYAEDKDGGFWKLDSGTDVRDANGATVARATLEQVLAQAVTGGAEWRLEQAWSPTTRAAPVKHRGEVPYLVEIVAGRARIVDRGIANADGSWRLASGTPVLGADGRAIAAPTRADILAQQAAAGREWRVEEIGHNPYADIAVEHIGVYMIDSIVVDYTVQVTDQDGTFYVWARNLDRALAMQAKYGHARDFNLRNYEVDFDTLDEVGSTDDSTFRVELLTPAQFHFATSMGGVDFQREMLTATYSEATGKLQYAVNRDGPAKVATADQPSDIANMIGLVDVIMAQYMISSRAFAVRMAMQGGLASFARDIVYDTKLDKYRPTSDRELAPMFEAIFEGAPDGAVAAAEYLKGWNELLWQIYPDYKLKGTGNLLGAGVAIDQAFIFQMMLPAFQNVGIDLDIRAAANALSIDQTKIVTHTATATTVNGTASTDFFVMTGGNQTLNGAAGADFYFVGKASGSDRIVDKDRGEADSLRFTDVKAKDIIAERDGQDLVLKIAGRTDTIRVVDQFLGELNEVYSDGKRGDSGVNSIIFADGVMWDRVRMAFEVADPRDTVDTYIGSGSGDVLWGGKGNDVLRGGAGGDTYVFERGDGQDVIGDNGNFSFGPLKAGIDFLKFRGDITADDLHLVRDGASADLKIFLKDKAGNLTGDSIYMEGQFGGVRLNLEAFGEIIQGGDLAYASPSQIERFVFDDGTSLDFLQIVERVLLNARTTGDDAIYGLLNSNTLDGGAGNDFLTGLEGDDTYVFGRGYGHDVVEDGDYSMKMFGSAPDKLKFIDDIRWTDLEFLRTGPSDTLTMKIRGTNDQVTLRENLKSSFLWGDINLIENVEFGDGTTWSHLKLHQHYIDIAKTTGNDTIYGFSTSDFIDGGLGDDHLEGLGGNDTFRFARHYGTDTILDAGGEERVVLDHLAHTDVLFSRSALDLIITVKGSGDRLILKNQYVRDEQQQFAVEYFDFSDRSVAFTDVNPEDIDLTGTSAGETITGSDFGETLDGLGGNDTLIGGDGGDKYRFDVGYGVDTIVDKRARAAWVDRRGVNVAVKDIVLFGDDITLDNVNFERSGNDLRITVKDWPGDELLIKDQFRGIDYGVERFEFVNGDFLTIANVESILKIAGGNHGDNVIIGSLDQPNELDGRQGFDTLRGGRAADKYAFTAGYDFDRIEEQVDAANVIDRVIFGESVRKESLLVRRNGNDLQIDLGSGLDVLTIVDGLTNKRIERFEFADGTFLTTEEMLNRMLVGSDGDDRIIGFDNRADILAGGRGSDGLLGGTGNDTYRFNIGDGSDSVTDTGGVDKVEFGEGITRNQISFEEVRGDLIIRLAGTTDKLAIIGGAHRTSATPRVESFVFADKTSISFVEAYELALANRPLGGQNVTDADAVALLPKFEPGANFDSSELSKGSRLIFRAGDGLDHVMFIGSSSSAPTSTIDLPDYNAADAVVRPVAIGSTELLVTFPKTGDQIHLVQNNDLWPTLLFADGVSWNAATLLAKSVESQAGPENDVIFGTKMADAIDPGLGNDEVQSGAGDDTILYTRGDGRDVVSDTSGFDTLKIDGYLLGDLKVARPSVDRKELVLSFTGSDDQIFLRYDNNFNGIDRVLFNGGGSITRDQLFALTTVSSTDFDDVIIGTAGNDSLSGGKGNDTLKGEGGADIYTYKKGDGSDVIQEGGNAYDTNTLRLPDHNPGDVKVVMVDDPWQPMDVIVRFGGDDEIRLNNVFWQTSYYGSQQPMPRVNRIEFKNGTSWDVAAIQAATLTAFVPSGPTVIGGTDATETLTGTAADEIFDGKAGNDTIVFQKGGGSDLIKAANVWGSTRTLDMRGYTLSQARFSVALDDPFTITIRFAGSDDQIVIDKAMVSGGVSWSGNVTTYSRTIQTFRFDDVAVNYEYVRKLIADGQVSAGDDIVRGTADGDVLEPGLGNDRITSLANHNERDVVIINPGDGHDTIEMPDRDFGTVELRGRNQADAVFTRLATNDGYRVTFANSNDSLVVRGYYALNPSSTYGNLNLQFM